jgi:hypothetical protein
MRLSIIFLFLLTGFAANSRSSLQWHEAVVVLNDHEVLVGEVVIQPSFDIVLFKAGSERTYYPVSKISYINMREDGINVPRKFVTHTERENGRSVVSLYEVVLQGEISVLRKPNGKTLPGFDDAFSFEYFTKHEASVLKLASFKRKVYPRIERFYAEKGLSQYLRKEHLDPSSPADAIKLIGMYNERLPIEGSLVTARR